MRPIAAQVVLITGSTDGLGKGVARELAVRGATVLLHGRDAARGKATREEIRRACGHDRVGFYGADFAVLAEVRRLAETIQGDHGRLDLLLNNAGIGAPSQREVTADGFEVCFAVNYLASFLLTRLLLPLIGRSGPARIVNVASAGQEPIDFVDIMLERGYERLRAYRQSKLAQIMFSFELARRLEPLGEHAVTVNALHPASLMPTKMVLDMFPTTIDTLEEGILSTLRLAIAPELDGITGRYFDHRREASAHRQAHDPVARQTLWEISEKLCGLT